MPDPQPKAHAEDIGIVLPGHLLDSPREDQLRGVPDGAVAIDRHGRIAAAGPREEIARLFPPQAHHWWDWPGHSLPVITPGLIDAHAHLPQYPIVARSEQALLPWLRRHVFPTEHRFTARPGALAGESLDAGELDRRCDHFFASLAGHGTTSAMIYAALWEDSTLAGFAAADRSGLRIAMGKVMMDRQSYGDTGGLPVLDVSLAECRRLIERWHGRDRQRLRYVVSPRFAVSCSLEMMTAAAALATEFSCPVQTHLAEQPGELRMVRELFPDSSDYTAVYERAGLLMPGAVLGHAIHLSEREIDAIATSGAGVAHCPTSNLFLESGLCPLDRLHDAGIPLALGSDVAGGPELNLWQVMRSAIEVQTARRLSHPEHGIPQLSPTHAFHLATVGGARVLRLDDLPDGGGHGRLESGCPADLVVWDLNRILTDSSAADDLLADSALILSQLIHRAGPGALMQARVRGRIVAGDAGERLPSRDPESPASNKE